MAEAAPGTEADDSTTVDASSRDTRPDVAGAAAGGEAARRIRRSLARGAADRERRGR